MTPRVSAVVQTRPASDALGAVVEAVDLSRGVDDALAAELRAAFAREYLLVFGDQDLADDDHLAVI